MNFLIPLLVFHTFVICRAVLPNKYVVIREKVTFFEAWRGCQFYGLELAKVTSSADNSQLRVMLDQSDPKHSTYWIAGTDVGHEGRWMWITNDSPIITYTNWGGANPNNANVQDCMNIGSFEDDPTLWDDVSCDEEHSYICERIPRKSLVTTETKR